MNFDSPFVEYLIIGTHTSSWLLLLMMAVFGIPLSRLVDVDAGAVLVVLPFVYLLGMLTDSIVFYPLEPFRKKIRDSILDYDKYKDEFIAYSSPELYSAYDMRMRRIRIVGAAIFNWPMLGAALLLHLGFGQRGQAAAVILTVLMLCLLSLKTWNSLYQRVYKFRKNACDTIRAEKSKDKAETGKSLKGASGGHG